MVEGYYRWAIPQFCRKYHLTAPDVTSVGTSRKEIEKKNYENYLTPLGIKPTTYQLQTTSFPDFPPSFAFVSCPMSQNRSSWWSVLPVQ